MGTTPTTDPSITAADTELAELCKALGHPARIAILRRLLHEGGCVCGEIVAGLPLSQATVSQHLKVLKQAGLLRGDVDGPRICYCADRDVAQGVVARLARIIPGEDHGNACGS